MCAHNLIYLYIFFPFPNDSQMEHPIERYYYFSTQYLNVYNNIIATSMDYTPLFHWRQYTFGLSFSGGRTTKSFYLWHNSTTSNQHFHSIFLAFIFTTFDTNGNNARILVQYICWNFPAYLLLVARTPNCQNILYFTSLKECACWVLNIIWLRHEYNYSLRWRQNRRDVMALARSTSEFLIIELFTHNRINKDSTDTLCNWLMWHSIRIDFVVAFVSFRCGFAISQWGFAHNTFALNIVLNCLNQSKYNCRNCHAFDAV